MSDRDTDARAWAERAAPQAARPKSTFESIFGGQADGSADGYRAFKACAPGAVSTLDLVPSSSSKPGYEISYFQSWTLRYLGNEMIAILCTGAGLIVFVEGRNLGELRDRLRERRISAIYEYDPATHGPVDPKSSVVTTLRVEMSNDLYAVHQWQKP